MQVVPAVASMQLGDSLMFFGTPVGAGLIVDVVRVLGGFAIGAAFYSEYSRRALTGRKQRQRQ
jgi:hypothetical protein